MAAPKTTVWELEAHTKAKHVILKRYLAAWVPILSQGKFPKFLYIDGFAGPGEYSNGEEGSPIIALKSVLNRREEIQSQVFFKFVELDRERSGFLQNKIDQISFPDNVRVSIDHGMEFRESFDALELYYSHKERAFPPTFAFIDPFGWKGVPFEIIERILKNRSCEVFVNFMYEEVNRFLSHPDQQENFDSFFGTDAWRQCHEIQRPNERNKFLHDLYVSQLRKNARYVRSFEMRNKNDATDYFLFFASNHIAGLKKMKEAMWKVDESGEFTFSDATDPDQLVLLGNEPRFDLLKKAIIKRFKGHEVTLVDLEEYVLDSTAFRETHIKRQILRPMELIDPPEIKVSGDNERRKPGTYPSPYLRIQFL